MYFSVCVYSSELELFNSKCWSITLSKGMYSFLKLTERKTKVKCLLLTLDLVGCVYLFYTCLYKSTEIFKQK